MTRIENLTIDQMKSHFMKVDSPKEEENATSPHLNLECHLSQLSVVKKVGKSSKRKLLIPSVAQ